ncbi:N-6 DNA methylase [Sporosarcina sp. 179-K 3D1 HS]|uniref:N-6 DNA methylase n=1 Tax=Sporosarcina sp. 179-K 3D1 HS TaxID=3232169 RepID=UPI00399F79CB
MGKDISNVFELNRATMEGFEVLNLSVSILAVGDANELRTIASSTNVVKKLIEVIQNMPYSELAKKTLIYNLRNVSESVRLSSFINMILDYAKLMEVYEAKKILEVIIQLSLDKFSTPTALPQQNTIVENYFKISEGETIFSGRIGKGSEVLSLVTEGMNNPIYGQDFAVEDLIIAEVRFYLEGLAHTNLKYANVLTTPAFENLKFDYVYDVPRFGYKPKPNEYEALKTDSRFNYFGLPSKMNADLAFPIGEIQLLNDTGKGAFYLTAGALSRSGADEKIRERLIISDLVEAVIEFPTGLYVPSTNISSVLILINKSKPVEAKNTILFINASTLTEVQRKKTVLTDEGVQQIVQILEERTEVAGISKIVPNSEISDSDLVPSRYIFENEMELDQYGKVEVNLQALNELNAIPLKDAVTIFRGYNALPKDEKQGGNVAMLKIADIEDGNINLSNLTRYELGGRVKIDNYRLQRGDIVLSIRGQLKLALFDSEKNDVLLSQNFVGIRCNHQYDPQFVKLYLESPTMQFIMHNQLTGSTVLNLATKDIEELKIPVLAIEEQRKIVQQYNEQQETLQKELEQVRKQIIQSKLEAFDLMGIGKTFSLS